MPARIQHCAQILIVTLLLTNLAAQRAHAQGECDNLLDDIVGGEGSPLDEPLDYDFSTADRCAPQIDELLARRYLELMTPEMFRQAKLASDAAIECEIQRNKKVQECVKDRDKSCPPSDECKALWDRRDCINGEAYSYRNELNDMNTKSATRALVNDLSEEVCVGDDHVAWDAIHQMWESLNQRDREAGEELGNNKP